MPDTKISGMGAAALPLAGDELIPIVQNGANRRVPVSEMRPKNTLSDLFSAPTVEAWAALTAYAKDQVTSHGGSVWLALRPSTGVAPSAAAKDDWEEITLDALAQRIRAAALPQATANTLGGIKIGPAFSIDADGTLKVNEVANLVLLVTPTGSANPASPLPLTLRGNGDPFALVSQAIAWKKANYPSAHALIQVAAGAYTETAAFDVDKAVITGAGKANTTITFLSASLAGSIILKDAELGAMTVIAPGTVISCGRVPNSVLRAVDVECTSPTEVLGITIKDSPLRIASGCVLKGCLKSESGILMTGGQTASLEVKYDFAGAQLPAMELNGIIAYTSSLAVSLTKILVTGANRKVLLHGTGPWNTTPALWGGAVPEFTYEHPDQVALRARNLATGKGIRLTASGTGDTQVLTFETDGGHASIDLAVAPGGVADPASPLPASMGGNGDPFGLLSQALAYAASLVGVRTLSLRVAAGTYVEPTLLQIGGDGPLVIVRGAGAQATIIENAAAPTGPKTNFLTVNGPVRMFDVTLRGTAYANVAIVSEGSSLRLSNCNLENDPNKMALSLTASPLRLIGTNKLTGCVYLAGPVLFGQDSKVEINADVGAGRALFHDDTAGFVRIVSGFAVEVETNTICWDLTGPEKGVIVEGARGIVTRPAYWGGGPNFVYRSNRAITKDLVYITQADYTALATKDPAVQYVLVPT